MLMVSSSSLHRRGWVISSLRRRGRNAVENSWEKGTVIIARTYSKKKKTACVSCNQKKAHWCNKMKNYWVLQFTILKNEHAWMDSYSLPVQSVLSLRCPCCPSQHTDTCSWWLVQHIHNSTSEPYDLLLSSSTPAIERNKLFHTNTSTHKQLFI